MSAVVVLGAMLGHRYPTLVPAALSRGLTVLGIDNLIPRNAAVDAARRRDPAHCLAGLADMAWIPDNRVADILDRVARWGRDHELRGLVVLGEPYVETASIVADCLGLRGPGLRASRICRNKLLQRRYLASWSPRSRLIPSTGRATAIAGWEHFPAIVKPIGRTASSGVRRVDSPQQLRAALEEYAPVEPAVVEEFVDGPELSVESLVRDGKVVFAEPTGKRTNESTGAYCVEMAHTVPDPMLTPARREAVLAANTAILDRLGFTDGTAHAEFRIGRDGRVVLMEVAARPAGDAIWALYHLTTGVPLEETLLSILLGEDAPAHPGSARYARQVYLPHEPGVLRAVTADGLGVPVSGLSARPEWPSVRPAEPPGLRYVTAGRPPGAELREIRESADRAAMFLIDADSPAALDRLEHECRSAIRVNVAALSRA